MLRFFAKGLSALHETERDERGFTLIELLIVVIIIGILAAIAIPTFLAQRAKAQDATCKSDTRNAAEAAVLFASANDGDFTGVDAAGPPSALAQQGFNQSPDTNTTAQVLNTGDDVLITSTCPGTVPNVTWSTTGANPGTIQGGL